MPKFKFVADLGYYGCEKVEEVTILERELEGLSNYQRYNFIQECYEDWLWEHLGAGSYWEELD